MSAFADIVLDYTELLQTLGGATVVGYSRTNYSTQEGGITKCC